MLHTFTNLHLTHPANPFLLRPYSIPPQCILSDWHRSTQRSWFIRLSNSAKIGNCRFFEGEL